MIDVLLLALPGGLLLGWILWRFVRSLENERKEGTRRRHRRPRG